MITKYFSNKAFFKILYNEDGTVCEIDYLCSDDLGNLYIERHIGIDKIETEQIQGGDK